MVRSIDCDIASFSPTFAEAAPIRVIVIVLCFTIFAIEVPAVDEVISFVKLNAVTPIFIRCLRGIRQPRHRCEIELDEDA